MNRRDALRAIGLAPLGLAIREVATREVAIREVANREVANAEVTEAGLGFRLTDVTTAARLAFTHHSGAYGGELLPETLGSGCAFLDYDNDGWQDIVLVNGADWPGHKRQRSTLKLFRNNRDGTFRDVTAAAGAGGNSPNGAL